MERLIKMLPYWLSVAAILSLVDSRSYSVLFDSKITVLRVSLKSVKVTRYFANIQTPGQKHSCDKYPAICCSALFMQILKCPCQCVEKA